MKARDPFKTHPGMTQAGMNTFRAIAARLAALNPPIYIEGHIAQREDKGFTDFSSLQAHDSTLDGINFRTDEPKKLAALISKATEKNGHLAMTSMKEEPDHWAMKTSFAATIGTGWREVWREAPYTPPAAVPKKEGEPSSMFKMRFGTAGSPINFTALHFAVHEIGGQCNIHIDQSGFVLGLPKGTALTPDLYDHIMNELKWKTDFRDWLSGLMPNAQAAKIVKEVIRRVSITFPNAMNGYADLDRRVKSIRRPQVPSDVLVTAGRLLMPLGVTVDAYENDYFKVQVTGTMAGGDRSIAVTIGGEW